MDKQFMLKALDSARKSGDDIPVGAVIVKDGKVIAQAHNEKEARNDVSAHAEILAIRKAEEITGNWRLNGCEMYVTLEPCPMCMWAILQSRIDRLFFGSYDTVYGALSVLPEMITMSNSKLCHKGGIMEQECDIILNEYFNKMRAR